MRGEFEIAAFQAMRAVEVAVRGAAGYGNEKFGVPMMRDAFSAGKGPLADLSADSGEQVARMSSLRVQLAPTRTLRPTEKLTSAIRSRPSGLYCLPTISSASLMPV